MPIRDLANHTSKDGITTAVWIYDDADTIVIQHEFMHLSFYKDDFRTFMDTLIESLVSLDADSITRTPAGNGLTLITSRE